MRSRRRIYRRGAAHRGSGAVRCDRRAPPHRAGRHRRRKVSAVTPSAYALIVLFAINLMNFFDRQIIGGVGEGIRREGALSDTALGLLGTGFTLLSAVVGLSVRPPGSSAGGVGPAASSSGACSPRHPGWREISPSSSPPGLAWGWAKRHARR